MVSATGVLLELSDSVIKGLAYFRRIWL
ncbi:Uncharacterized protein APZ42_017669 [Daphnia magna]|uniref:Uncharacterized protein n=1 Tax=Daphnia magna TaxID=35525 RepID=A0A164ZZJ2_9CRUS|nr:Uncharacterized protein APZ42_017669 [Daphnia magna]